MKTFEVSLTKSYTVTIKAENAEKAQELSEFYTSDIKDLSSDENRVNEKFEIEKIECKINEAIDVHEIGIISE